MTCVAKSRPYLRGKRSIEAGVLMVSFTLLVTTDIVHQKQLYGY